MPVSMKHGLKRPTFAVATRALTGDHIGKMCKLDLMAPRARAENARLAPEDARLLFELHREEHGC
jgi:hypothetical protein